MLKEALVGDTQTRYPSWLWNNSYGLTLRGYSNIVVDSSSESTIRGADRFYSGEFMYDQVVSIFLKRGEYFPSFQKPFHVLGL